MDQEKYILEQIRPIPFRRGRRSDKMAPLNDQEFTSYRSLIYQINWVGKESRPEVAGVASILASHVPHV